VASTKVASKLPYSYSNGFADKPSPGLYVSATLQDAPATKPECAVRRNRGRNIHIT